VNLGGYAHILVDELAIKLRVIGEKRDKLTDKSSEGKGTM